MHQWIAKLVILIVRLAMELKHSANLVQMDNIYHHKILVFHAFNHVLTAHLKQLVYHVIQPMSYRTIHVKPALQIKLS